MKRVLTFCVLFYLLMNTSAVLATENGKSNDEGEKGKRHGLLVGTLKNTTDSVQTIVKETVTSTERTVKDTVDYTKSTVETLVAPKEQKPVTTIVGNTGKLVEKTVKNTVPVVSSVTSTVTETVNHTTTEVDATLDKLPPIPVVTPIVDEVRGIVDHTTTSVVDVVDQTVDTVTKKVPPLPIVEPVVEEVKETVTKTTAAIRPVQKEEEKTTGTPTVNSEPDNQLHGKFDNNDQFNEREFTNIEDSSERITLETTSPTPELTEKAPYESIGIVIDTATDHTLSVETNGQLTEVREPEEHSTQVEKITDGNKTEQVTNPLANKTLITSQPYSSSPLKTEKNWRSGTWAIISTGNSSTTSPALAFGSNGDTGVGVILNVFLLSTSSGKQWVHPDDKAMMQWTHAPPGRPPQTTPFLYVNSTY